MFGPSASNPFDVCGALVATYIRNAQKLKIIKVVPVLN
jgi:hypothetical protein